MAVNKKPKRRLDGTGSGLKGSSKKNIQVKKTRRMEDVKSRPRRVTIKRKIGVRKITLKRSTTPLGLKRSHKNPIIEPTENMYWESKAAFNPTALYHDGKVHVIYRAIGDNDISVLGYAKSKDGHSFDAGLKELAYYHKKRPVPDRSVMPQVLYGSGGGWGGGSEDPRLTLLGETVYMIYTSFDGWGSVRRL